MVSCIIKMHHAVSYIFLSWISLLFVFVSWDIVKTWHDILMSRMNYFCNDAMKLCLIKKHFKGNCMKMNVLLPRSEGGLERTTCSARLTHERTSANDGSWDTAVNIPGLAAATPKYTYGWWAIGSRRLVFNQSNYMIFKSSKVDLDLICKLR